MIMYDTPKPEDFRNTDFNSLIRFRINRILMICSNYDAFIMEEDGHIESQVYKEYVGLNMSGSAYIRMGRVGCGSEGDSEERHWH